MGDDVVGAGVLLGTEYSAFDGDHADVLHIHGLGEAACAAADRAGNAHQTRAEEGQHYHGEDEVVHRPGENAVGVLHMNVLLKWALKRFRILNIMVQDRVFQVCNPGSECKLYTRKVLPDALSYPQVRMKTESTDGLFNGFGNHGFQFAVTPPWKGYCECKQDDGGYPENPQE